MIVDNDPFHPSRISVLTFFNIAEPYPPSLADSSIARNMSVFTLSQGVAVILVFTGVWLVIKSKSKRDVEKEGDRC